ncbi:TrbG/VirB9 family P-type conjugative transfer protein [Sphingopyxis sp. BSN-002]|uniref:TrbG/VirB9 family P-type conjugative transfer protein n=1 Tax=Sphingopyxis sp. BSN-002 TaxID=2911495 RepID=UPI001EDB77F2|nr:TrbG/VirB9 family P-type conjugative transfer protein [Sphingopyxis sp. BSN-002]UKK86167.1 TrbG/VirB9 family P-type conjugative transfer protein [Sphingopyxis sp. BSN-002]
MIARSLGLLLMLFATGAQAQVRPQPSGGDQRMQVVDYRRDQVVQIEGAPGYQVLIALAPDERIQNVALGDSGAWQVVTSQGGNMLFVRPTQDGISTNMTVITSARFYAFDLVPVAYGSPPYEVRFNYPADTADAVLGGLSAMGEPVGSYRLSGTRALWPVAIHDDGTKTYIDWPADTPLPAAFIIDEYGRERLANGNMRGGLYVIDSVHQQLLFRIDQKTARAKRYIPKDKAR